MSKQDHSVAMNHDAAWELLPWYVNGTLQASERALVDQHLRSCLLCHRELDEQQQLDELVRESETVRISPRSSFDSLMRRIDSSATANTGPSVGFRVRELAWLPAAAAILAVGVVLVVLYSANPDRSGDFRTLSSETTILRSDSPALQMVFAQAATEEEIRNLLAGIGGRIVGGPSGAGVYTIELLDGAVQPETLKQLQADERVRFIGQAYPAPLP